MRDGIGKPVFHTAPRARGRDLEPVRELPYRPAADERPQQRPNRCQHLTTRDTVPKILLALTEASTDVKMRDEMRRRDQADRLEFPASFATTGSNRMGCHPQRTCSDAYECIRTNPSMTNRQSPLWRSRYAQTLTRPGLRAGSPSPARRERVPSGAGRVRVLVHPVPADLSRSYSTRIASQP